MRTVQAQGPRPAAHPTRGVPQRSRTTPKGTQKSRLSLMQRIAQGLGISTPARPQQSKVTADRFTRQGTYDHIARQNIAQVYQGQSLDGRPTKEQCLNFLNGVIVSETKASIPPTT